MGAITFNQDQLDAIGSISLDEFAKCLSNALAPACSAVERIQVPLPWKLLESTDALVEQQDRSGHTTTCEEAALLAKQQSSLPRSTGTTIRLRVAEHVSLLQLNDPLYFNALTVEMASDVLTAVA